MANYTDTETIIGIVKGLLEAPSGLTVPVYDQTKPTPARDAVPVTGYVVVNALKVNADVMQRCIVNCNYHAKDTAPGTKNTTALAAGTLSVLNLLQKVNGTNYLIDFESQETLRDVSLGEHFSNMRFSFKYINT